MLTDAAGYSSQKRKDNGNHDDSNDIALVQDLANYLRQNQKEKYHRNGMEQLVEVFLGDELSRLATSDASSSVTHDGDSSKVVEMMTSTTMATTTTTTSRGSSNNDASEQLLLLLSQKDQFQKVLDAVHRAAIHNKNAAPPPTTITKPKSSTTTTTSFSILDTNNQFQFNAERVTAEQILQCCCSFAQEDNSDNNNDSKVNEQLWKLIHRIDHLDDISYMWDDIRPSLVKQLQHRNYIPYLWNLTTDSPHQPDYKSIRYDLCVDIMNQISYLVTQQQQREGQKDEHDVHTSPPHDNDSSGCLSSSITSIPSLWNTWHKIWCQFMSSTSLYALSEQDVDNMALQVWTTIVKDGSHTTGGSGVTSFGVLALIDPHATWFSRWIPQLSIDRVLQALNKTQLLGFVWKNVTIMPKASTTTTTSTNNSTEIENGANIMSTIESACHIQALGILQSTLAVTRVSRFPFYLLEREEQCQEESQKQMIEPYLRILLLPEVQSQNNHHEERIIRLCLQAIEIIIMGTKDGIFVIEIYGQLLSIISSSLPQGIKQQLCYSLSIKVLFEKDWGTTADGNMTMTSSSVTLTTKVTLLEMMINFMEQQQVNYEDENENSSLELQLCPYDKRDLDRMKMELVSATNN